MTSSRQVFDMSDIADSVESNSSQILTEYAHDFVYCYSLNSVCVRPSLISLLDIFKVADTITIFFQIWSLLSNLRYF